MRKMVIKEITRELTKTFLITSGLIYLTFRPTMDILSGNDSIFSRYLFKPIFQQTEEEYQHFLEDRRKFTADYGDVNFIKLLTFPNNINYEDYKSR